MMKHAKRSIVATAVFLIACGDPPVARDGGDSSTPTAETAVRDSSAPEVVGAEPSIDAAPPVDVTIDGGSNDAVVDAGIEVFVADISDAATDSDAVIAIDVSDATTDITQDAAVEGGATIEAAVEAAVESGTDAADEQSTDVTSPCATPRLVCGGVCTDVQSDEMNCGRCGNSCSGLANTTAAPCASGVCAPVCVSGFANCDRDSMNGCEAQLASDTVNCGTCGTVCRGATNAVGACTTGTCGLSCNTGFGNCDGDNNNGCETNVLTDRNHCGRCGNRCSRCTNGACT